MNESVMNEFNLNGFIIAFQSVIQMPGFRSLGGEEQVEFECKVSDKGLEATRVSGPSAVDCHGSKTYNKKRLRKLRYILFIKVGIQKRLNENKLSDVTIAASSRTT
jgi:hypothetical protein